MSIAKNVGTQCVWCLEYESVGTYDEMPTKGYSSTNDPKKLELFFHELLINKRKNINRSILNKRSHENQGQSPYQGLHFIHVLHGLVD
jgi:hypothetical protein